MILWGGNYWYKGGSMNQEQSPGGVREHGRQVTGRSAALNRMEHFTMASAEQTEWIQMRQVSRIWGKMAASPFDTCVLVWERQAHEPIKMREEKVWHRRFGNQKTNTQWKSSEIIWLWSVLVWDMLSWIQSVTSELLLCFATVMFSYLEQGGERTKAGFN